MYEYANNFAPFGTQAQARESRATLKHLDQYGVAEVHQVELANLAPGEQRALRPRASVLCSPLFPRQRRRKRPRLSWDPL